MHKRVFSQIRTGSSINGSHDYCSTVMAPYHPPWQMERALAFNKPEMLGPSTLKMAAVGTTLLQGHKALAGSWRVSALKETFAEAKSSTSQLTTQHIRLPGMLGVRTHAHVQTHILSTYRMPCMLEPERRLFSTSEMT